MGYNMETFVREGKEVPPAIGGTRARRRAIQSPFVKFYNKKAKNEMREKAERER